MAKAPFERENMPSITTAAQNVAAGTAASLNWAGVTTADVAIATGGETGTDSYSDTTDQYIIDKNTLEVEKESAPKLSDSRQFARSAQLFNTVFVCGGQDEKGASDRSEIFTSFGKHKIVAPLKFARTDHAVVALQDNVFIAGGSTSKQIECYTINFTQRMIPNELPTAVRGLAGTRFGNFAVFAGGRDYDGRPSARLYALDNRGNVFPNIPDLSVARYNLAAGVVTNPEDSSETYLIVAGGKESEMDYVPVIDVYDSDFNRVATSIVPLDMGRSRIAVGVYAGYILFGGGVVSSNPDEPSSLVEIYNYRLEKMENMALSVPRNSVASTVLGDTVMFIGGVGVQNSMSNIVDGFKFTGDANHYNVKFEWSTNSEVKTIALPHSIEWPPRTKIYPKDLPALPIPASSTVTVTGWYIDSGGELLLGDTGTVVGDDGLILYARSEDSSLISVSFDYAKGDQGTEDLIDLANNTAVALDADILGEDSTIPTSPAVGEIGDLIELPPAEEMTPIYEGTEEEMQFVGWFDTPEPDVEVDKPITEIKLGSEDETVYAVYEPAKQVEREEVIEVKYMIGQPDEPEEITRARKRCKRVSKYGWNFTDIVADIPKVMPHVYTGWEFSLIPQLKKGGRKRIWDPTPDEWALETQWVDFATPGEPYVFSPPVPTDVSETAPAASQVFITYFEDEKCTKPMEPIASLTEDTVVYCKFATKAEVVLEDESVPETYNIEFRVDGLEDAITEDEEAGIVPPNVELPPTISVEPLTTDDIEFGLVVDEYDMPNPQEIEGYDFEGYYSYDDKGNKVEFDPTEPIEEDMVLYPKFEFIGEKIEKFTPVTFMVMDTDTVDTQVEDVENVPINPLRGLTNPMMVTRGEEFDPSTVKFPNIPVGYRIDSFWVLQEDTTDNTYKMVEFKKGVINEATSIWVTFTNAMPEMPHVSYHSIAGAGVDPDTAAELEPVVDAEPVAPSTDAYEGRPPDLNNSEAAQSDNYVVTDIYADREKTTLFDPTQPIGEGEVVELYMGVEKVEAEPIMVTVDYYPPDLTKSDPKAEEQFDYATPSGSTLPSKEGEGLSRIFPPVTTGEDIIIELGDSAYCQEWEPKVNSGGTCFWIEEEDEQTEEKVLVPFEPDSITSLTESITLYPQYDYSEDATPNMEIENIPTTAVLTPARSGLAGASVILGVNSSSYSSSNNSETPSRLVGGEEHAKPKTNKKSKKESGE